MSGRGKYYKKRKAAASVKAYATQRKKVKKSSEKHNSCPKNKPVHIKSHCRGKGRKK